jgi:hypothetical protein
MPRIIACGGRQDAFESFTTAQGTGEGLPILLVDSEVPVDAGPWQHLEAHDGWARPADASDGQCHLMVQVMEAWFLADRSTLASFYGRDFREKALPGNPRVEQVTKNDVLSGLHQATRSTQKGDYQKGSHGFEILGRLDPSRVATIAPHAKRFLEALQAGRRD